MTTAMAMMIMMMMTTMTTTTTTGGAMIAQQPYGYVFVRHQRSFPDVLNKART